MSHLSNKLIDDLRRGECSSDMLLAIEQVTKSPLDVHNVQQYDQHHGLLGIFLHAVPEDRISDFGSSMSVERRLLRLEIAQSLWDGQLVSARPRGANPDTWGGQPINALLRPSGEFESAHRLVDERTCQLVLALMSAGALLDVHQGILGAHASTPLHRILETSYPVVVFMQRHYNVFGQWAKDVTEEEIRGALESGSFALNSKGNYPRTYRNHALILVRALLEQGERWPVDTLLSNGGTLLHHANMMDQDMTTFLLQHFDHRKTNDDGLTVLASWARMTQRSVASLISYEQIEALLDHDPDAMNDTMGTSDGERVRDVLIKSDQQDRLLWANPYYEEHPSKSADVLLNIFARAEQRILTTSISINAGKTVGDKRM